MIKKFFGFILKTFFYAMAFSVLMVVVYKWAPVPATPLMVIRSVQQHQQNENVVWQHNWVPLDKISKNLQLAVICSEDQNFLKHNGFDMKAIEKAYQNNLEGKRLKGGSTISQQTAKNVFLWPQRSWTRKALEVYFTFLIALIWTKERIMEVYLNSIEMGPGIYGAEAAAQYWFAKPALKLTAGEGAAIASVLPSPLKYKANPASLYIENRKHWILKQMNFFGPLNFNVKK